MALKFTKKGKTIIIILCVVASLLTIAGFWAAYRYRSTIKKELTYQVITGTDSLYHISVKRVGINIINRAVTLKDVHLWPDSAKMRQLYKDSAAPALYYHIRIPRLRISGIMWDKLTGGKGFSCAHFTIRKPDIRIYRTDPAVTVHKKKRQAGNTGTPLYISDLAVEKGTIRYYTSTKPGGHVVYLQKADIVLSGWQYDPLQEADSMRFLMADDGRLHIGKLHYHIPGNDYAYSISDLQFDSRESKIVGRDLRVQLKISEDEFYRRKRVQKEIYTVHLPTIEANRIDWQRLINRGELYINTIYLNNSSIGIFFSRIPPENKASKMGKFPNQQLLKLKLPVYVEDIRINNGDITYTELNRRTRQKASIYFTEVDGNVHNVTNMPQLMGEAKTCTADLVAKFNEYADMKALFAFSLDDTTGKFTLDAQVSGVQARQITQQTKALSLLEIKSLNMRSLALNLSGDEKHAKSDFTMLYTNLSVKILSGDTTGMQERPRKKKGLLSFVANNLILYSGNPMPGAEVRTIKTYLKRDSTKSFFNLIWKNLQQGVQETTIRDMDVIRWMREREQNKDSRNNPNLRSIFNSEKKQERKRDG